MEGGFTYFKLLGIGKFSISSILYVEIASFNRSRDPDNTTLHNRRAFITI